MPDYVYALHDFLPEHEDEVNFHAGERIEVVEKDDMYGDGWWKGRNLTGKVGLFPVSYTAPAPPAATTTQTTTPLPFSGTEDNPAQPESSSIVSPVPKQPPVQFLNGNGDGYESDFSASHADADSLKHEPVPDNEVMKATMTDVQKAIEQLGRGASGGDRDGGRSFSFASSRDGADTDTDYDLSDIDGTAEGVAGDVWHKTAREKLAAKARRAIEEAEKLEAMMVSNDSSSIRRSIAPPIEVELSDESEDEDYTRASRINRPHSYILEEDETEEPEVDGAHEKENSTNTETETYASSTTAGDTQLDMPPPDESQVPTATAATLSFPTFSPPPATAEPTPEVAPEKEADRSASPERQSYPTPVSPPFVTTAPVAIPLTSEHTSAPAVRETPLVNGLPSPQASTQFNNTLHSKHNSIVSTSSAPNMIAPAITVPLQMQQSPSMVSDLKKKHPTEWSVEEVIEWLKTRGFDTDVFDKFTEQEITGDVLLELDVNLLKSEIGIMAFGKRMRIANAIADLRRPPSIEYDPNSASASPMQLHHTTSVHSHVSQSLQSQSYQSQPYQSQPHSRTQSMSQSHHSFSGSGLGQSYVAPSPHAQTFNGQAYGLGNQFGSLQEGVPAESFAVPIQDSKPMAGAAAAEGVGLGIAMASLEGRNRPAQLSFSPSEGNLKESNANNLIVPVNEDDDRGHLSDSDIAPTAKSVRRRLFGRSHDSSASFTHSSRFSPIPSPTVRDTPDKELKDKDSLKSSNKETKDRDSKDSKDKDTRDSSSLGSRHARTKKSLDGGRHGDRLSIFGGSLGTLGKSRKPPPSAGDEVHEKHSKFSLPRLSGAGLRKASSMSQRSHGENGSPKDTLVGSLTDISEKGDAKKDHTMLRKRTLSKPDGVIAPVEDTSNGSVGPIKQGQNILEQIGEPDHTGWMRKKGDRYNTWKLRYFILKGPHLYCLRSNNKSETRIKGYIHITGYKVTVDENVDPGRYGFRIDHDQDKTHYFSSDEKTAIRDWMKAIMKATIGRDYTKPVVSSCNIPTIPLVVAQAMNPAPRPPSPTARDATQKALRREHPDQLSSRDARVLMGLASGDGATNGKDAERARLDSFFSDEAMAANGTNGTSAYAYAPPTLKAAPPRPSREMRRTSSVRTATNTGADDALIEWANGHLPDNLQITDVHGPLCGGLALLRLAESIKGRPSSPPVLDSAFPTDPNDDKLDGLFRLFDFLLDNDVKMGSVSINDVRQGKREKIVQLLRALKAWEDKRRVLANTITKGSIQTGGTFMVPTAVV